MFSTRLSELRKKKGFSQYKLADELGFSRGQVANYEQGTREPDYQTLLKIADFFNVSTDYLLGRDENNLGDTIAAHIDSNATEEDIKEILAYIDEKRKEHTKEKDINITETAPEKDKDVDNFVEENEEFKAVAERVMNDKEAIKAVKSFIEYYEQQKNK
ncbi:TPA: helix-turn-helix domain-containing protein [Listeria innocua]|nr:helix-turn-helix domain-containing protein [Listeria innocua]HCJ4344770.1 helix-turn-helix domain-containing protein [Listeria innocua]HCJ4473647.1 helix-turn-helix domain-containing protein [Listeria innocua]HCJ4505317.1 helix-turn-helix domain-containing protein [Listeria innocua]HCJ4510056.1 helix-turn-helix domain-containing protein [Listeria innocua]